MIFLSHLAFFNVFAKKCTRVREEEILELPILLTPLPARREVRAGTRTVDRPPLFGPAVSPLHKSLMATIKDLAGTI